ncbi:hypothetical protein HMPREF0373_02622 [Eubacterium ramulus ATCC 29099]|uniref:Uncharacterized protein n=1 Tax=Eubacterium ramulus ATCC 29099 TaxID=1256908 RepID=U2NY60_EUBRA|nr:hypothetical protein HMPREF0373_02622 [Eubacterium ramulus ATCC 29099]
MRFGMSVSFLTYHKRYLFCEKKERKRIGQKCPGLVHFFDLWYYNLLSM